QEILAAKERGVDIQIMVDATGAANASTAEVIAKLRAAGITVKVENWGGKQHMKGGVIDDTVVTGSMNWTNAGEKQNDENCLVIKGDLALAKRFIDDFDGKFATLPTLTAYGTWSAESFLSRGSLIDGADNDHWNGADPLTRNPANFRMQFYWAIKQL